MSVSKVRPTGVERFFDAQEIIVSKTDPRGIITYTNRVFVRVSGYEERELIGQPHNLIRHPEMPRAVFQLLWSRLQAGQEIFAYINNLSKNGDHYWVLAHVTPSFDARGNIVGYHSNRRVPERAAVEQAKVLYRRLLDEETRGGSKSAGLAASTALLEGILAESGQTYDEWVWGLTNSTIAEAA
ncbi:PAS domain-containing protein [Myxococcota bacterium]|nr:PAS domain-containing protein [Myxococcota bacterium]